MEADPLKGSVINLTSDLIVFDILILRKELTDAARHLTRQRARPPMSPYLKLGDCTDMTTLFTILINDHKKKDILSIAFAN